MKSPVMTARVLPAEAVKVLQRAAKTPITPVDPLARLKAIDAAIDKVKRMCPECFRHENDRESQ
jgi:hypothetical protein